MSIRIKGQDKPSTLSQVNNDKHGIYSLLNSPNLYEIQRSNNYEFIVTGEGFTNGTTLERAGTTNKPFDGRFAQEVLRLSVTSSAVPHFTMNTIEVKRGNGTMKFAGTPSFESGSFTYNDYIGAEVKDILMAWQAKAYNIVTEKVGLVEDYKRTCYLVEYSPDMQEVRRWVMEGCWISGLSESEFNSESNDTHRITATIQYDRAYVDTSSL